MSSNSELNNLGNRRREDIRVFDSEAWIKFISCRLDILTSSELVTSAKDTQNYSTIS